MPYGKSQSRLDMVIAAGLALWGIGGAGLLWREAVWARQQGRAPTRTSPSWPEGVARPADRTVAHALVFLHGECSCSAATLDSIEGLASRHPTTRWTLLVRRGTQKGDAMLLQRRLDRLAALPQVQVLPDPGAQHALASGATTSGHMLWFPAGTNTPSWTGGLTPSRGHLGWTPGWDLVDADSDPCTDPAPVFGCPLGEPTCGRTPL